MARANERRRQHLEAVREKQRKKEEERREAKRRRLVIIQMSSGEASDNDSSVVDDSDCDVSVNHSADVENKSSEDNLSEEYEADSNGEGSSSTEEDRDDSVMDDSDCDVSDTLADVENDNREEKPLDECAVNNKEGSSSNSDCDVSVMDDNDCDVGVNHPLADAVSDSEECAANNEEGSPSTGEDSLADCPKLVRSISFNDKVELFEFTKELDIVSSSSSTEVVSVKVYN